MNTGYLYAGAIHELPLHAILLKLFIFLNLLKADSS